mgnify:CR=1 FL=1
MATKLFLRESTDNGISGFRDALTTPGSSATTGTVVTDASTQRQWEKASDAVLLEWVSGRSPAGGWTLSGTLTFSIWAHESATSGNAGGRVRLFHRATDGTETEIGGGPWDDAVEFTKNTPTEMTWTGTPTSKAFIENERLVGRVYITNVGTMGTGQTCTLTYDAADAATGDSFIQLTETVTFKAESTPVTVSPGVGALTVAGFIAAITQIIRIGVGLGALTVSGFAPVVHVNPNVSPPAGTLSVTGYAPTITATQHQTVQPGVGALTVSGFVPTVGATDHKTVSPSVGELSVSGLTPVVHLNPNVYPATGEISVTGFPPTVTATQVVSVQPGTGALSIAGFTPTISITDHKTIQPGVGELSVSGFTPTVSLTDHKLAQPGMGALSVSGFAPVVTASDHKTVQPSTGTLSLSGFLSIVIISGDQTVSPALGVLTLAGYPPTVIIPTTHRSTAIRTVYLDFETRVLTVVDEERDSEVDGEIRNA